MVATRCLQRLWLVHSVGLGAVCLLLAGCPPEEAAKKPGTTGDTVCPKEMGPGCKVLKDEASGLSVEYHVLVASDTKNQDAQKYLQVMYRHLMTRRDLTPNNLQAYLYTHEAQFKTPPPSPVGIVLQKPSDKQPSFENKVAPELWQQVEEALKLADRLDRKDTKLKRRLEYIAEPDKGKVTIKMPFTAGGTDNWSDDLSFSLVLGQFSQFALDLFNNISDLKQFVFQAQWKDQTVANIECDRTDFNTMNLREVEDRVGRVGGRAFLELSEGKTSDAVAEKRLNSRKTAEYRKITTYLKQKAIVSPLLK